MKPIYIIAIAALLLVQCKANKQAATDDKLIKDYTAKNNIAVTRTNDGLYYVITNSNPAGKQAFSGSVVSVRYTGRLLDGTVFDNNITKPTPLNFVIGAGQVIAGWDEGISLMKKGEKAKLFIPSFLAYGSTAQGSIPANSVLYFDVELVDVN